MITWEVWLNITNNQTFASVLVLGTSVFFAFSLYKRQKGFDREEDQRLVIVNQLSGLQQKVESMHLFALQIINTHKNLKKDIDQNKILKLDAHKTMEEGVKYASTKMSLILMEEIPLANQTLINLMTHTFPNSVNLKKESDKFQGILKKWHDFFVFDYKEDIFLDKLRLEKSSAIIELRLGFHDLLGEVKNTYL